MSLPIARSQPASDTYRHRSRSRKSDAVLPRLHTNPSHRLIASIYTGLDPTTTPGAQTTFKAVQEENSIKMGSLTIGKDPNLHLGGTVRRLSGMEEVVNRSKIVALPHAKASPGETVMRWDYAIDDGQERKVGLTLQQPPSVKFGFTSPRPHSEVDMLMYWSMSADSTGNNSGLFKWFSSKSRKPLNLPAFTNIIQRVSISIPTEKLTGHCWVDHPRVQTKTTQPLRDDILQCQATDELNITSKGIPQRPVDLNVAFGCALYGQVKIQSSRPTHGEENS